jgi:molybdopterin-guanine dinucleotide biosynthesis protein A
MSKEFDESTVLELEGKPLLSYVVEAVQDIAEQVIVVTDNQEVADAYQKLVPTADFVVNKSDLKGPLLRLLLVLKPLKANTRLFCRPEAHLSRRSLSSYSLSCALASQRWFQDGQTRSLNRCMLFTALQLRLKPLNRCLMKA